MKYIVWIIVIIISIGGAWFYLQKQESSQKVDCKDDQSCFFENLNSCVPAVFSVGGDIYEVKGKHTKGCEFYTESAQMGGAGMTCILDSSTKIEAEDMTDFTGIEGSNSGMMDLTFKIMSGEIECEGELKEKLSERYGGIDEKIISKISVDASVVDCGYFNYANATNIDNNPEFNCLLKNFETCNSAILTTSNQEIVVIKGVSGNYCLVTIEESGDTEVCNIPLSKLNKGMDMGEMEDLMTSDDFCAEDSAADIGSNTAAVSALSATKKIARPDKIQTSGNEYEKCMQSCAEINSGRECWDKCEVYKKEESQSKLITPSESATNKPPTSVKTKQIEVFLNQEKGDVTSILGMAADPNLPWAQEAILSGRVIPPKEKMKNIGMGWVRLGPDDGVEYSLDGMFLDNSKSADDKSNYDFRIIDEAFDVAIKNGARPLHVLGFDINVGARVSLGHKPDDYDKWVKVAINVIKHFNGMFDVPKQGRSYSKGDVIHFTVWDEPSDDGTGSISELGYWTYGNFGDFWRLYKQFADAVDADPDIKNLIKVGQPAGFYHDNGEFTGSDSFLKKLVENNTRMDFLVLDKYDSSFYQFLDPNAVEGLEARKSVRKILETTYGYKNLETYITAFGFNTGAPTIEESGSLDSLLGYSDDKSFNYESHYGAALLTTFLIYSENAGIKSFIWEASIGGFGPVYPMGVGNIFSAKSKLTYEGLAYKMFSKMLKFNENKSIKVNSKGDEFNYAEERIELLENKVTGYQKQDTIQILASKSKNQEKINVLVSNWNNNPKESRYDSYNLKINDALDGNYNYKVYVIDEDHSFPQRCDKCPWWDNAFKSTMPETMQDIMTKLEKRCPELKAVYCPARINDKSIGYDAENELGIAKQGTVKSVGGEINLRITDVQSSAVHLIEFIKR